MNTEVQVGLDDIEELMGSTERNVVFIHDEIKKFVEIENKRFDKMENELTKVQKTTTHIHDAIEVLIFKGNKSIPVKRGLACNPDFNRIFRKLYEK